MREQAFGIAQVRAQGEHLHAIQYMKSSCTSLCGVVCFDIKRQQGSANTVHLLHRQCVLRVTWQAWVIHTCDKGVLFQPLRHL